VAALAVVALAGCGDASGLTAAEVVEELSAHYPLPNPRDNTASCAGQGGCVQLITTDAVSVYQWPDEATAKRFAGGRLDFDQEGPFVLSYAGTEQRTTDISTRVSYMVKLRELLLGYKTPGTG
jgi:hypothetical protein